MNNKRLFNTFLFRWATLVIMLFVVLCNNGKYGRIISSIDLVYQIITIVVLVWISFLIINNGRIIPDTSIVICSAIFFISIILSLYILLGGVVSTKTVEFSIFITFSFPFCLFFIEYLFKYSKTRLFALVLSVILFVTAIACLKSRTAIISITLQLLFYFSDRWRYKSRNLLEAIIVLFFLGCYLINIRPLSVLGRLQIWRVCLMMIRDHPLFGLGVNGFERYYMLYQASFFDKTEVRESIKYLAGEVVTPYNEFFHLTINHGVISLIIICFIIIMLFRKIKKTHNDFYMPSICFFIGLFVTSLTSYPFKYSYTWLLLYFAILLSINVSHELLLLGEIKRWSLVTVLLVASLFPIGNMILLNRWQSLSNITDGTLYLEKYESLYNTRLGNNCFFLSFYAKELFKYEHYEDCIILLKDKHNMKNYDNTILLADCYYNMNDYQKSIFYYKRAHSMIPSKFLPCYMICKAYQELGDPQMIVYAKEVVNKKIKKDSIIIQLMIRECQQLLSY